MPVLIATPFATNGTKNDIPETTGAQPQNATMEAGFPAITQQPISTGGIPPERADFNGILYALSDNISHINKGLAYSFDTTFATKIGGYPLHAELVMADGTRVVSTIANNMNNPDVDLTGWRKGISASNVIDESGKTQQEINNTSEFHGYANFYDIRAFGATTDRVTDYTTLIRDTIASLPSYIVLYIPFGVKWNYTGIYGFLKDYQTIIDDSGRDEARNLWQATRVTWRKTNANTGATNGNTESIAGDYHPAYIVDTYAAADSGGARASIVYRHQGIGKWQAALDFEGGTKTYNIAQYGTVSYGTVSLSIGHQDDPDVIGKIGFNSSVNSSSMLLNFNKPTFLDDSAPFSKQYQQSATSTGDFQTFFKYGAVVAYREDIKVDGTHQIISKNFRRITTTADCVRFGTRKNVKALTASATLTVDETDSYVSNVSASGAVTVTLPKAALGLTYEFSIDAAFNLRIVPNASDNFIGMVAQKYKESSVVGSRLRIIAVSSTQWSFVQTGTWTNQA